VDRLERLINLTATLIHADRLLTADDIRERVPGYAEERLAFRRAFERDKEVLRELGVPIEVAPLDPAEPAIEGYRIPRAAYELPDPGLESEELAALNLAAATVRLPGTRGVEALWKLGGAVLEGPPPTAMAALPGSEHLEKLFDAVNARRLVTFGYRDRARTLEPHRLAFRNGRWYLGGFDRDAAEERWYRLDRFEPSLTTSDAGSFVAPERGTVPPGRPWELGEEAPITAQLLVDGDQAGWAVAHLGADAVAERRPDGAVVLAIRVTNRAAFRSFVLGFLDHAEVLGPPELRDDIVSWLAALCPEDEGAPCPQ
jgi:proteasome accessory factor B